MAKPQVHNGQEISTLNSAHVYVSIQSQSGAGTDAVSDKGCKLSMYGRGAWRDNVFVERVWRSAKYERIYLKAYDGVAAARADIAEYFDGYNTERPHSSLDRINPEQTYRNLLPKLAEAA